MQVDLRGAFESMYASGIELSVIAFELEIPLFVAELFAKNIEFDPENFIDDPRPQPTTPTDALAGSQEKIEILRERASRGVELWHPEDNLQRISEPLEEIIDEFPDVFDD